MKIYAFQERAENLNDKLQEVERLLAHLAACPYERQALEEFARKIQAVVDEMLGYSNLQGWVSKRASQRIRDIVKCIYGECGRYYKLYLYVSV